MYAFVFMGFDIAGFMSVSMYYIVYNEEVFFYNISGVTT